MLMKGLALPLWPEKSSLLLYSPIFTSESQQASLVGIWRVYSCPATLQRIQRPWVEPEICKFGNAKPERAESCWLFKIAHYFHDPEPSTGRGTLAKNWLTMFRKILLSEPYRRSRSRSLTRASIVDLFARLTEAPGKQESELSGPRRTGEQDLLMGILELQSAISRLLMLKRVPYDNWTSRRIRLLRRCRTPSVTPNSGSPHPAQTVTAPTTRLQGVCSGVAFVAGRISKVFLMQRRERDLKWWDALPFGDC